MYLKSCNRLTGYYSLKKEDNDGTKKSRKRNWQAFKRPKVI